MKVEYVLVCRITNRKDKHGERFVAVDALDGREVDEDYSEEHLRQRLAADGWKIHD